jgi:nicotinamidase-related amidase
LPVTAIDPRTALLVVDLQRGTAGNPTVHPMPEVTANASRLAAAFRQRDLPVVLIAFDLNAATPGRSDLGRRSFSVPDGFTDLVPELDQRPGDLVVTKRTWSGFAGTGLDDLLRERGVSQVVIVGVATSFGVESTARDAYDRGYHVTIALDAVTDLRVESHEHSVTAVLPVLAETGSTADILAFLA